MADHIPRIKEAAICRGGKVWTGHRHGDIIPQMVKEGEHRIMAQEQGFVTEDGRFVNRAEAFEIALVSGQVKEPGPGKQRSLLSEDLY